MPKLSNKKKREIALIGYVEEVINETYPESRGIYEKPKSFVHNAPDTWHEDEILIFDALTLLEEKVKKHTIELIEGKRKWNERI